MKILVIGSGLMGPAAAYNALLDKDVKRVTLADANVARSQRRKHGSTASTRAIGCTPPCSIWPTRKPPRR